MPAANLIFGYDNCQFQKGNSKGEKRAIMGNGNICHLNLEKKPPPVKIKFSLLKYLFPHFFITAISREDGEDSNHHQHQINHYNHSSSSKRIWKQSWHQHRSGHSNEVPFNGYNSEEYLDRLEPNGNIPANKSDLGYGKRKWNVYFFHPYLL